MVTMVDEIYDRNYQDARSHLNEGIAAGLARLGRAVRNSFDVLHRIEYDAPWRASFRRARSR